MTGSLRHQAMLLTVANGVTRATGFAMHLLFARWMGAEALGVMELSHSVGMLALTPVTAGIPSAMSRLTAQRPACDQEQVLRAGVRLVSRTALLLIPALVLLSPFLAWLLGDRRTLPAILTIAPHVLLLGLGAVYSGYCYGRDDARTPAICECVEQGVRFALAAALLAAFRALPVHLAAAIPGAAEAVAGIAVVLMMRRAVPMTRRRDAVSQSLTRQIFRLSAPTALARLCMTGSRMLGAVVLPVCLRLSGLSASAATAQFGLFSGMVMPLMMLPGIVTSAMCMVTTPAISRQERTPGKLCRTMRTLSLTAAAVGAVCSAALFLLADFISVHLYNQPALSPLLRVASPAALLFAIHQVQGGMITGLGLQKRSLTGTLLTAVIRLALTAWLCPISRLRIFGAALAMLAGQLTGVLWDAFLLRRARRTAAARAQM